jgi:hypothetical protein
MGCTKSQLLALINRIYRDVSKCHDMKCVKKTLQEYKTIIEENAETEAYRELLRP